MTVDGWVAPTPTGDATAGRPTSSTRVDLQRARSADGARPRCTAASSTLDGGDTRRRPTPLEPAELPDLGNGPHFFYGLQWWFFGLLAIFGFGYLV